MRHFLYIPLLLAFASVASAVEQPKGFGLVPKEKLDGARLLMKEAGASLTAPNADWVWLTPFNSADKSFMCFSNKTGAGITVSIGDMVNGDMDEHTKTELITGCKQSAAKQGATVSNEKFEPSEIPFPKKSWRYSYTATAGPRKVVAIFYYIRTAGRSFVTIQGVSVDGVDTPTFHAFVSSLKMTEPAAPAK